MYIQLGFWGNLVFQTCGALLSSTSSLNKHRATHSSRGFICGECGKSFHRRDGLEGHMATHMRHRESRRQRRGDTAGNGEDDVVTSGVDRSSRAASLNASTTGGHQCHMWVLCHSLMASSCKSNDCLFIQCKHCFTALVFTSLYGAVPMFFHSYLI